MKTQGSSDRIAMWGAGGNLFEFRHKQKCLSLSPDSRRECKASIVTGLGDGRQMTRGSIPGRGGTFHYTVQTSSGATTSHSVGKRSSFTGDKTAKVVNPIFTST
jgi:hypothetical protein